MASAPEDNTAGPTTVRWSAVVTIAAVALVARVVFLLWAPGRATGDGFYYHLYARAIAAGLGYVEIDGSPAVNWMPGWPAFLAGLYTMFGAKARVGMFANTILGAGTAGLLAGLATRWFGARIGTLSGLVYALWPALIYLCATAFPETLFNFILVVTLCVLAMAIRSGRTVHFITAGVLLATCALTKADVVAFFPVVVALLWMMAGSWRGFRRTAAWTFATAALVILPWSLRNYARVGHLIPLSANGGIVAFLGHHPNTTGRPDIVANVAFARRIRRSTRAESAVARSAAGWREAWAFARSHPREELRLAARKLRLTYDDNSEAATYVRGFGGPANWLISARAYACLAAVANAYWFAVLGFAIVGVGTIRRWPREARVVLLGLVGTWMVLHIVFIGGDRYRVPEAPAWAVLAACGMDVLRRARTGLRKELRFGEKAQLG